MANTDDLIREATRNGEERLRIQMQIALAADQRAVSLGGILAAAASVVLGFLLTDTNRLDGATSYICLFLSVGLCTASMLAFYSVRPVSMRFAGNKPSYWRDDIESDKPIIDAISEQMLHIDKAIDVNETVINSNAKAFGWAMATAAGTIAISVISGVVVAVS